MTTEIGASATSQRSLLLTALYVAQEQYGYLSPEAVTRVAERLNMPVNAVYSAASFYAMFRFAPVGRYVIQVCEGLSCHLAGGAESLIDYLCAKLDINPGQTTPDGLFTVQTVQCLASCGSSPALRVNDVLYEHVTLDQIDLLLEDLGGRG
jgi:NADH-quinone oxidoreductase subunit E